MIDSECTPVTPRQGWHVMHLFYHVDYAQWALYGDDEKRQAKTRLTEWVQEIRATPDTHLLVFSVATSKADLGFMLLTPDLQVANSCEKQLGLSLGPEILSPAYSYFSQTEVSEYVTTRDSHAREILAAQPGLAGDSVEFSAAMRAFDVRCEHLLKRCLYPVLPDWPVICFYPMSRRRADPHNWYALPFEERRKLMDGQDRIGRAHADRVLHLVTGSTGLDEYEWAVTLLAKDTFDIKAFVSEMRFDDASARYADFGDCFIGLQLPLDVLFRRICL
jgi:chlorite dismutase